MATIDSDIPIPDSVSATRRYPFPQLEIGQSFFVPASEKRTDQIQTAAHNWAKYNNRKLTVRRRVENGITGTRVWRIA